MADYVLWFESLGMADVPRVGGKNASLGEMIGRLSARQIRVPLGFATTAEAYREFIAQDGLARRMQTELAQLDVDDMLALAAASGKIKEWIIKTPLPAPFERAIAGAFERMRAQARADLTLAVRSSATAEDLPQASFAGQQETYLNVRGLENVLLATKRVFASLYSERAIAYRVHQGFAHDQVALSVGVQQMVRSDLGTSGVMFTLDTESGFREIVFITASYGLGETVVQGSVNPDEFYVFKPTLRKGRRALLRKSLGAKSIKMIFSSEVTAEHATDIVAVPETDQRRFSLTDSEVEELARQALIIEEHYGMPMDIEWAKDGVDGQLYILQARPETVKSRDTAQHLQRYQLKQRGPILATGRSIGARIGVGTARVVVSAAELERVAAGDVLVTDMTDPDWEPIMKRAAGIVTNRGGRTCHAAIIARELGVPAVVGCGDATASIAEGAQVTVSCAEGATGYVYRGRLDYEVRELSLAAMPPIPVKIMMNVANVERAFDFQALPNAGVGLARLEFIINRMIGIHPKAVLDFAHVPETIKQQIRKRGAGYPDPITFFVQKLTEGIATIAAAFYPKPVIVRLSDFKSNEYANLLGGADYEPTEENPMLGFRGASRYLAPSFRDCFELECRALRAVRDEMGLNNVEVMVPFVRTVKEAEGVVALLKENGLTRGENGLRLIMMCEIPSNALLAEEFLKYFDGFSIGSNDLTQLTLGLDRDSALVAQQFDERDPAVKILLRQAIQACRRAKKYIGICGQGPSDHPDLAHWLLDEGIDSLSLNPDTVIDTWLYLANQKTTKP